MTLRSITLAAAAATGLLAIAATPASADWDGWHGRPYGHHHRHYDGPRYYAPPPVVYAPAPVYRSYYAPPPVYYVPPSVNFGFTFR